MPRPAEIEVEECAAPNGSYSLSARRVKPERPPRAQRADAVAAAGDDLVRIGLVADVPDQPVARRVEHPVQRNGELDNAEAGAEVAAGHRYGVDRFLAQLGRELRKVGFFELAQILGRFDAIEKRRLRSAVHRAIPCCDHLSLGYVTLSRPRKGAIAAEGCAKEKRGSGGSRAVGSQSRV